MHSILDRSEFNQIMTRMYDGESSFIFKWKRSVPVAPNVRTEIEAAVRRELPAWTITDDVYEFVNPSSYYHYTLKTRGVYKEFYIMITYFERAEYHTCEVIFFDSPEARDATFLEYF